MEENSKKINYGISILKVMMAFLVVIAHFYSPGENDNLIFSLLHNNTNLAVPVFFIISSYYYVKTNRLNNSQKTLNYIKKLFLLNMVWTGVYIVIYLMIQFVFNFHMFNVEDIFWQLLFMHSSALITPMWYIFDLIVLITIIYFLNAIIKKKNIYLIILFVLVMVSYIFIYTGINFSLFNKLRYEMSYPIGRIVECFPFVALGTTLAKTNALDKKSKPALILSLVFFVIIKYLTNAPIDFGYGDVSLLFVSLFLFSLFYKTNDYINNKNIISIITKVSAYTKGIYCSHILIGTLLYIIPFKFVGALSFVKCVCIYVFCYILSFILDKIGLSKIVK